MEQRSDVLEKAAILLESITEADFILIGIGEEFAEKYRGIEDKQKYKNFFEKYHQENTKDYMWMIPYVHGDYLLENDNLEIQQAYQNLFNMIQDKNYFIVSTCRDHLIHKAGFQEERIVEPCGNYRKLQCEEGCQELLFDSKEIIEEVMKEALDSALTLSQVDRPICTSCGRPLVFNNIKAHKYIESDYLPKWQKYSKWLQATLNKKLCVIELGVGLLYPTVIRWPFEKIAFYNQKASFFRIHHNLFQMTEELAEKGVSIQENAVDFLRNKIV